MEYPIEKHISLMQHEALEYPDACLKLYERATNWHVSVGFMN